MVWLAAWWLNLRLAQLPLELCPRSSRICRPWCFWCIIFYWPGAEQHLVDMFEPIDIIHGHDLLDDDEFSEVVAQAESELVGAGVAAPFCCKHSRATLRRPGPRPVRPPELLDGVRPNSTAQPLRVQESSLMQDILSAINRGGGLIILENTGSSMTWLDDQMVSWVHAEAPFAAHAHACQFGAGWAKVWCFVSNRPENLLSRFAFTGCCRAHGGLSLAIRALTIMQQMPLLQKGSP